MKHRPPLTGSGGTSAIRNLVCARMVYTGWVFEEKWKAAVCRSHDFGERKKTAIWSAAGWFVLGATWLRRNSRSGPNPEKLTDHLDRRTRCRYNLDMERGPSNCESADRMARECIAVRVRLINRVISALYDEALRPFGLRISQANILAAVAYMGEARPAEISRILRIEKSTLSRDVELMKQNGWIESDPPAGGRNQTVRLTRHGKNLVSKIQPSWEKAQAEAKLLIGDEGESALRLMASRLGFGEPAS